DQTHLYGRSVRWFHDPGVPDDAAAGTWRSLGARVFAAAATGPVQLNLPFREPLVGQPGPLPPRRSGSAAASRPVSAAIAPDVVDLLRQERGVILAGGGGAASADLVGPLAEATGWPVLADPTSGLRTMAGAVASFDALLRHERMAAELRPDVLVRIGRPAASKVLAQWVQASGAPVVQVGGPGVVDPDHTVVAHLDPGSLPALAGQLTGVSPDWRERWTAAAAAAEAAVDDVLGAEAPLSEPAIARTVARHLPAGAELVVASSMPVRDLEWFGGVTARAHANRGANGIDGVMSTALGIALGGRSTVVLIGDIAFVHDAGALTALAGRGADLRIVVVDNDGGGIFSFLPQASALTPDRFEQLFGTPHGTDVVALARAHGLDAVTVTTAVELVERLTAPGPSVTRVATDRADNVRIHAALNAAVATALATI
ncbi:MAG: thiamine pyrophosphate-dependent enzyme, partial [Ilumatobacteraceae bacterium]